jgi:hypothetical protein
MPTIAFWLLVSVVSLAIGTFADGSTDDADCSFPDARRSCRMTAPPAPPPEGNPAWFCARDC